MDRLMDVAVLGTGRLARFRAKWLAAHPDVDRVWIGSRDVARAESLAAEVGGRGGTISEVLEQNLGAAVVSSSTDQHAPQVSACIARGLPTLCEKPLAMTLEQTQALVNEVEAARGFLQVSFQRRFDPGFAALRTAIASGSIGTVYHVRLNSHDHEPAEARFIATSGGIFRDLLVHDFDIARWLVGCEVHEVYAVGTVRKWQQYADAGDVDTANVLLTMTDGTPIMLSGARHNPRGYDFRAEVFGSSDTLTAGLDWRTPLNSVEADAPRLGSNPYSGFFDRFGGAFEVEMQAFMEAVQAGKPSPCSASDALEALRIAVACDCSLQLGTSVKLSDVVNQQKEGDAP
jgi:myo-inositol 2-dehydrogenase / D-chiro-inositol 1-dehydrogenase